MSSAPDITVALGGRLLTARLAAVMTQEEVAAELGVSVRSYQDYEAGKSWPQPRRRREILAWLADREAVIDDAGVAA